MPLLTPKSAVVSSGGGGDTQAAALVPTATPQRTLSAPSVTADTAPSRKKLALASPPPAAPKAAQIAPAQPSNATASSGGTSSSSLIRAIRPSASASRVQPQGGVPNVHTADDMRPPAGPPPAPTNAVLPPGGLIAQPRLKGNWAGPEPGSPAAHMDLTLPCL